MAQSVGGSGVANFANTSPSAAIRVVAYTSAGGGAGNGVGGSGVTATYSNIIPALSYLLLQAGAGYLLLENGGKIIIGA
jgi:hypothetical protein